MLSFQSIYRSYMPPCSSTQAEREQRIMTTLDLTTLDETLTARAGELARSLTGRNQIVIERSADDFDNALLSAERESSALALSQDVVLLRQVEAARDRLRDGTFGICQGCEEEIAPKRLRAIPWAAYCLGCQARAEESGAAQPRLGRAA
jgi:DnaK suppressor protein